MSIDNLQLGHLKVIRVALSKQAINEPVDRVFGTPTLLEAIAAVDNELATKYNVKAVWKTLPKKPYQREPRGEYVFEEIVK